MIDEKRLEEIARHGIAIAHPSEDAELIRLARLGLWAEKHGVPALGDLVKKDNSLGLVWERREKAAMDALAALPGSPNPPS